MAAQLVRRRRRWFRSVGGVDADPILHQGQYRGSSAAPPADPRPISRHGGVRQGPQPLVARPAEGSVSPVHTLRRGATGTWSVGRCRPGGRLAPPLSTAAHGDCRALRPRVRGRSAGLHAGGDRLVFRGGGAGHAGSVLRRRSRAVSRGGGRLSL